MKIAPSYLHQSDILPNNFHTKCLTSECLTSENHRKLHHRKLKKIQLREVSNGWLHPWAKPAFRYQTRCRLGRSTPSYFKLNWMSCCRSSGMSNSRRSRWKHAELIVIWVLINLVQHTRPSNIKQMTQRYEALIKTKSGYRTHLAPRSWRWHSAAGHHTGEQ